MSDASRPPYDPRASGYDQRWGVYIDRTLHLLESHARIRPGERVLDVGCGTGAFEARLVAQHPEQSVVGVDVSGGMLAEARRKLAGAPNVRFVEAPAEALPFTDASFDVVVSSSALHYSERPDVAVREAARVLRPGGRAVILDWDRGPWWMALLDAVLRTFDSAHVRTLTADEIRALLVASGLSVRIVMRVRQGTWGLFVAEAIRPGPAPLS